jgi:cytochrome c553
MKVIRISLLVCAVTALIASVSLAAGNVEKGKALFNDPEFAGGVRACSQCHPGGSGLENAGDKNVFHVAGGTQHSLEEAVNACIVGASGGRAIGVGSEQMKDIVAYIRSLKKEPAGGY